MQYADAIVKNYLQYAQRNGDTSLDNDFQYQDPTYLGFYFYINPTSTTNTGAVEDYAYDFYTDGLFRPKDDPNSASFYLKSRGETYRAEMIDEFVAGFLTLVNKHPWYLLSVSGLGELWKFDPKQNYRGKDKKITFETNESVDLRMTYLLDLYRKASFDTKYMRYMLPENLRYFNAELYVAEIRSLHTVIDNEKKKRPIDESLKRRFSDRTLDRAVAALGGSALGITGNELRESFGSTWNDPVQSLQDLLIGKGNSKYPLNLSSFNELATFLKFDLGGCEFDAYAEAPKYLDSLTNTAGEAVKNNFSIKVSYVKETNTYGLLGAILKDTPNWQNRKEYQVKLSDTEKIAKRSEYAVKTKRERGADSQAKRQAEIEAANAKRLGNLGGIVGNLVNQGINAAVGQVGDISVGGTSLNGLAQAFRGKLLGNVYDGPSISEILASSTSANLLGAAQQLISRATSPELAQSIIDKIILESPMISTEVSPAKSEGGGVFSSSGVKPSVNLDGKPATTSGDTDGGNNAVFVVTGTEPSVTLVGSNMSSVPLLAPSSSPSINPKVELEAAPVSTVIQPIVELTGGTDEAKKKTTEDGLRSESIKLTGDAELEGVTGKTELSGDAVLEGSPGAVTLIGKGSIIGKPESVELEGLGELEGNPGKEELTGSSELEAGAIGIVDLFGTGEINGNPGKTLFQDNGAELEGNPGREQLTGAFSLLEGNAGVVQLVGEGKLEGNPGKETLDSVNSSLEGNTGTVQLEGEGKLEGELGSTDLSDNGSTLKGVVSNVSLTGADSNLKGEAIQTELKAPPVPEAKLTTVEFAGEGKLEGVPGIVKLNGPDTELEGFIGIVKLDGGGINDIEERNIGIVTLDGEERLEGNPGSVKFKSPESTLETFIGKVKFEQPKINNDIPATEELIEPKVARADANARVIFEGPSIQLDANSENVNLSGPQLNLTTDSLGNSNPEQSLFENYDEE